MVIFADFDRKTIPAFDRHGHARLVWHAGTEQERRVGVDLSNIQAPESDRWLARRMLLARIDAELRGRAKARPTIVELARECALSELESSAGANHDAARERVQTPAISR